MSISTENNSNNNSASNTNAITPAIIAKKLSAIVPANTKEVIEEVKSYLDSQKLDKDGYRQIWKGIFFAMWASDKVPVQQALADELANLIFSVNKQKFEAINMWFQACFNIMNKEWAKIDYWRVNKFSSLMRKVITAFIRYLRKKGYNTDYVRQFSKSVHDEFYVEQTQTVSGLALHIMQIFPEVLSHFTSAKHDQVCLFLDIFLKQLNPNSCKGLRQKIKECIFEKIIELKNSSQLYQNFNLKAYREKLFDIAKKKKTDDVSRKEIYEIVELIDANVQLDEEDERYNKYIKEKEENRQKVNAEKELKKKAKEPSQKKNKDEKQSNKKEEKVNKKADLENEEQNKQKKQKLNDTSAKSVDNKQQKVTESNKKNEEQKENKSSANTKNEEKLTKQQKKELKKQEKLQQMIDEEEKKLLQEEKKLNQMEQKLLKQEKNGEKLSKNAKKQVQEPEQNEEDWDDEEDDEEEDFQDEEGEEDDEDEDDEDFQGEEDEEDDEEEDEEEDCDEEEMELTEEQLKAILGKNGDLEDDEDELDEEELQMLIKGTAEDIEVDDMDDDFYCEDDFEGYDIQEVTNNPLRINGLQNVYNSLPEYHFLSDPQKIKYFNNLTSKFKQNLLKEKTNGCSHKKSVIINTNNNLIKEFDLNEEVTAISKAPVIKKAKKVKTAA
ncbi:nucleolar protein,Nop52 protein (macronuclear) [Tetrahymena thermophila SB210]|uniref:Nucleolar protein,Nop52 protein n=1 Tax=Tetrahymena thermophila (strain SB210) TaxID=312017 RepID=Q236Y1_TETTS|nr:nucleolar protein,Nop52 protein [Tetrahymena thermophila SB210]EAR92369.1 nucleolar protein,Nop52 protein [Tetrahymena thermophila SB210]|eukprot:XP_001012614.1 nucleolar protein,Nop52 protein [Tetrahymena thermophila SB210]